MNKKRLIPEILIFIVVVCAVWIFTTNDAFLYKTGVAKITKVRSEYTGSRTGTDGSRSFRERYYRQTITAVMKNGSHKGKTVTLTASFTGSGVYDTEYSAGDFIFVEALKASGDSLTGTVTGTKRDALVITILTILFGLFLLVGGRRGALTVLSLVLNMAAFYVVLMLYTKGINMLVTTIPMTVFFTAMLLFFMYGKSERTGISFVATLVTVAVTTLIAAAVIHFGGRVDYDFMDYLNQPYEQRDANLIFLSEILVGCLGAVMDVVVTMVMTVDQIAETGQAPDRGDFIASCRAVGDDLIGTMIGLMFFTNIAASLPFFLLSLRNGIGLQTVIRYNIFFELARFLTGSIGVVLAIPVSASIAVYYYRRRTTR